MGSQKGEEVGDLFVTEQAMTVELLPSHKTASRPISWFSGGAVKNVKLAAKDIAYLVGKLHGKSVVVKGLTVMTDRGLSAGIDGTRLDRAIEKAGFEVLK